MERSEWNITICGLNCARCGLFKANKCGGCRGAIERHWSPGCKMRSCALGRGHTYCFECGDFPCENVLSFAGDGFSHHKTTVENMKRMKTIGIQAWIDAQPAVLFCPGLPPS